MDFEFSERLKSLRAYRNLTLEEVARRVGVSKQTVFKYENGIITTIPYDKIIALAEVFQVAPADLLGWSEEENKLVDALDKVKRSGEEDKQKETPPAPEGAGEALSEQDQRLLSLFSSLSDEDKGRMLERAEILAAQNRE